MAFDGEMVLISRLLLALLAFFCVRLLLRNTAKKVGLQSGGIVSIARIVNSHEVVRFTGVVVSSVSVKAYSGVSCVHARLRISTKTHPAEDWGETPYFLSMSAPFSIVDETGSLDVPNNPWIKGLPMVSSEIPGSGLVLHERLKTAIEREFGREAIDSLQKQLIRVEEFFLPVGTRVYATCTRSSKGLHIHEISAEPIFVSPEVSEIEWVRVLAAVGLVVSVLTLMLPTFG